MVKNTSKFSTEIRPAVLKFPGIHAGNYGLFSRGGNNRAQKTLTRSLGMGCPQGVWGYVSLVLGAKPMPPKIDFGVHLFLGMSVAKKTSEFTSGKQQQCLEK